MLAPDIRRVRVATEAAPEGQTSRGEDGSQSCISFHSQAVSDLAVPWRTIDAICEQDIARRQDNLREPLGLKFWAARPLRGKEVKMMKVLECLLWAGFYPQEKSDLNSDSLDLNPCQ